MKEHATQAHGDLQSIADAAQVLIAATTDVAGDKVAEARKRLAVAIERGRETWSNVRDKAVEGARAADQSIRDHPYQAIGIAIGVGAVIGFLLARRN